MAIEQIRAAQLITSLQRSNAAASAQQVASPFEDLLKEAVTQALSADASTKTDAVSLVMGSQDSPHTISINTAKADLAVEMLVSVRNKALDAYNEIMRTTL